MIVHKLLENLTRHACTKDEKIPTYCSSATTVASGCFATLAIDDKGIGEKTAAMADQYLKGKAVEAIASIVVDVDYCTINAALAQKLETRAMTVQWVRSRW